MPQTSPLLPQKRPSSSSEKLAHCVSDFVSRLVSRCINDTDEGERFVGYEIDFLAVGSGEKSGDAIALRFGDLFGSRTNQRVVVVDGGFQETGEQLVAHIRKFYQTDQVDLVVSTHPDADHVGGLQVVLETLEVGALWMHRPWLHTRDMADLFKGGRVTDQSVSESLRKSLDAAYDLERVATRKRIPITEPFVGLKDESASLLVVGPTRQFYEDLLQDFRGTPEPKTSGLLAKALRGAEEVVRRIAENWDYETLDDTGETSAENNSSAVLLFRRDGHNALLTADAGLPALDQVAGLLEGAGFNAPAQLNFIQVPHHGSQRNSGPSVLNRLIGPKRQSQDVLKTAFVSVAKDADSKHPSKKVTNAFRRRGAAVHATQGVSKRHRHNAPDRDDYEASTPLPFYAQVED